MSASSHHAEWLSLVEVTGPFLTLPVLEKVFPQGLEARDPDLARDVKFAYGEWRQETESRDPDPQVHEAWLRLVIDRVLGYPGEVLEDNEETEDPVSVEVPEQHEHIVPDYLLREPRGDSDGREARLAIEVWPAGQELEDRVEDSRWVASPARRMARFCKSSGIRLGLVTNGERWMLVNAPEGETTGFISWYAHLWTDEPLALRSFRSLLGVRRFFGVEESETLTGMLEASKDYQAEVTDRLGDQVRRAVEVLIEALDKADADTGRELLEGVSEERLYEAALTVMMRLVFLFCAEERDLLLLGDDQYDQYYAVSTLGGQLRETADRHGLQILEHREDAWGRLLATFRAIYGGIQHEDLRLPAYGSSLFDPDRFPFLEGRPGESGWRETPADPLPIDNRTVLHLLDALQLLQMQQGGGRKEARKLSYRSLDIEQIGYVYERLLDHSAVRADGPVLGLQGTKYKEPEIPLAELEDRYEEGEDELVDYLHDMTGRTKSALRKRVDVKPEGERLDALRVACGDDELLERVLPFQALLREDPWGDPIVIGSGSVYVTEGTERQATGTHYTPRALTEEIVQYALEPLVYEGPSEGRPRDEWDLESAEEILDLKVCDPAMGSGAFLVQTVRWLGDRVQEAWEQTEDRHGRIDLFGQPFESSEASSDPVPTGSEERQVTARRLVAERCVYGVDVNPLAVEIAKLSIWLVTLAVGRPFSFLDHNLRRGDSLLGVSSLDQLYQYHPRPEESDRGPRSLFDPRPLIEETIGEVSGTRERMEESPVRDISDSEEKQRLYRSSRRALDQVSTLGDVLTSVALAAADDGTRIEGSLEVLSPRVRELLGGGESSDRIDDSLREECERLTAGVLPDNRNVESFLHWPLEFPEVYRGSRSGFDAIVMNPPFKGGRSISGALSTGYREYLVELIADGMRGANADLCAYFLLRAASLLRLGGTVGSLATNSVFEGDTREVGLDQLVDGSCSIFRAVRTREWPGSASLQISQLWFIRDTWTGSAVLDGEPVDAITAELRPPSRVSGSPYSLKAYERDSFEGSKPYGSGFVLAPEEAKSLIQMNERNREVVKPYLSAQDLYSEPTVSPTRWVLDFGDMTEDEARTYGHCWKVAEERVKPYRMKQDAERYPGMVEEWWKFWNQRQELYTAIMNHERVLALGLTSKTQLPAFVSADWVFAHSLGLIVYEESSAVSVFSSNFHWWWGIRHGSTLENRIRYSRSDCFVTFPQPGRSNELDQLGENLEGHRRDLLESEQIGITQLYNRYHDSGENTEPVEQLRELHRRIDRAVASAYGWTDLPLEYDFQETRFGTRYTWGLQLRTEIMDRLLELNHARHAEETDG